MSQNMVSLTISDEQATSAMAGVSPVGAALPGLVSLEPDDRKGLVYMGAKSEVFCRQTIRPMEQNPQFLPLSMDLAVAVAELWALDSTIGRASGREWVGQYVWNGVVAETYKTQDEVTTN